MAYQYEESGTVNLTNGSATVTGVGTNWVAAYEGVLLNIDGLDYPIKSIDSGTSLTLNKPYPGTTATGVSYQFVPVQANNYALDQSVNTLLDSINDLIENGGVGGGTGGTGADGESAYQIARDNGFIGTEAQWLASLKGADGADGAQGPQGPKGDKGDPGDAGTGDSGLGAIVNLKDYVPQPAGGSGVSIIVPFSPGEPGVTLTQSAQVIIPYDKTSDVGIALWASMATSGYAITLGLTNAPLPQPGGSDEPVDLTGSSTIYGAPGSIFRNRCSQTTPAE